MVMIKTKKIAITTTPTPPYPTTEVVSVACVLDPSSTELKMALACYIIQCIARHGSTTLFSIYFTLRHQLLNHMSQRMRGILPGSGGNTFHQAITTGINEEYITISGSPQTQLP